MALLVNSRFSGKLEWNLKCTISPRCLLIPALGLSPPPPSSYVEWFKMGCSGLQAECQECETSERKCESFSVIDTCSVCHPWERKDNEICVGGGKLGFKWQNTMRFGARAAMKRLRSDSCHYWVLCLWCLDIAIPYETLCRLLSSQDSCCRLLAFVRIQQTHHILPKPSSFLV